MELPPIRYVHTDDGVSIAYTMFGDGPPLLYSFAGPALSNFEHEWNLPGLVAQYEAMAEERTVVRFDWRNSGLSTRHVDDVTIEAHLRDLLTLQDHLGFERAALRVHGSAPIAIRYAAAHPDRVSALVLSSPSVIVASPDQVPSVRGRLLSIEGRQADALRAYQDYRSFLADEVGTGPSPSVHKIEQRVASSATDERREVIERLRSMGRWSDDGPSPGETEVVNAEH